MGEKLPLKKFGKVGRSNLQAYSVYSAVIQTKCDLDDLSLRSQKLSSAGRGNLASCSYPDAAGTISTLADHALPRDKVRQTTGPPLQPHRVKDIAMCTTMVPS